MNEWIDFGVKSLPYIAAAIGWAIRQEIRANRQEDKMTELQKTIDEDRKNTDDKTKALDIKLDKILDGQNLLLVSQARTEEQIKTLYNDRKQS